MIRLGTLCLLAVAGASTALVGIVRRIVVARGVLDHPSERSSHVTPTPRGGGLGVVTVILCVLLGLGDARARPALMLCLAGCAAVAAVGWLDDRRGMPVWSRLLVHTLAGLTVGALADAASLSLVVRIALFAWWTFWTVSSINVVNFMDGINGLVTTQVAIHAASLTAFGWADRPSSWYAAVVAAACVGFLPWNFPRARIFLGDVGSGALGFLVPMLAVLAMGDTGIDVVRAHLPLFPLFGDGTVTIVRRWRRGESLTQAHRSHLYQRLANGWLGHTRVTLLYAAASIVGALITHAQGKSHGWLAAVAYVVGLGLLAAYLEQRLFVRASTSRGSTSS